MRYHGISLLCFCIAFLLLTDFVSAQYPASVRIMTYNINAQGHGNGSYDDIAGVIQELDPDIAGFQKLDSCNSRNPIDVLGWLGEQTDRYPTFAPALKNFNSGTGSYGVGFLTKSPPDSVRRLWLQHTANEEDRGVCEIGVTMGGEHVRLIVTHLAHEGEQYRTGQIEQIITWIDNGGSADDPVIIMADFNASPDEASMRQFEEAGFIYVQGENGTVLDTTNNGINHILYRPESSWNCSGAGNPRYDASNRNPVWADMELVGTGATVHATGIPVANIQPRLVADRLNFSLDHFSDITIRVVAPTGKLFPSAFFSRRLAPGNHSINLPGISLMPPGVYYGILTADASRHRLRFSVIK